MSVSDVSDFKFLVKVKPDIFIVDEEFFDIFTQNRGYCHRKRA